MANENYGRLNRRFSVDSKVEEELAVVVEVHMNTSYSLQSNNQLSIYCFIIGQTNNQYFIKFLILKSNICFILSSFCIDN